MALACTGFLMGGIVVRRSAVLLARPQVDQHDPILGWRDHTGDQSIRHADAAHDSIRGDKQILGGTAHRNDHQHRHFDAEPNRRIGLGAGGALGASSAREGGKTVRAEVWVASANS